MREVVVVGAGLHRYGVFPEKNAIELGTVAIQRALDDAGCQWTDIEAVYCGTVRLGMSAGHSICRHIGTTGLAITNVENASASGSSAVIEECVYYEALGLVPEGEGVKLLCDESTALTGRIPAKQ
jgi:acetyl-CoA acetyltransferase